jgi:hypothetical protein
VTTDVRQFEQKLPPSLPQLLKTIKNLEQELGRNEREAATRVDNVEK